MAGVRVTSGWFNLWRSVGFVNETELYWMAVSSLVMSFLMAFAGWFHYHRFAPKLEWFQSVESMLGHHVGGLLGMGSVSWAGHQVHVSIPINYLLDTGVDPREIPLPHELIVDRGSLAESYPSFSKGLTPLFALDWAQYGDLLTFKGGLNPLTGGLWMTDVAHHHLAVGVVFVLFGTFAHGDPTEYAYRALHEGKAPRGESFSLKSRLDSLELPLLGKTHEGIFEILVGSLHAQLSLNLAMLGSVSIIVSHHMYAMPPYPYIAIDYATQLSLFVHHMWIGGFCIVGAGAHASLFMVRDYNPVTLDSPILDEVLGHRDVIISHLNWVCIFLGFHSFGLYCHNDTMRALGRGGELFSDSAIALKPLSLATFHSGSFRSVVTPGMLAPASYIFDGGGVELIGGEVAMGPIRDFGTADFLVHHIHAFNIHVTALVLLKGVLFARSSRLIPDKAVDGGFRFPCDGPGRGGTCQVSGWDHVFLALFWMYNTISITIFYFDWRMSSGVWGTLGTYTGWKEGYEISEFSPLDGLAGPEGFGQSALTIDGWLRDYLWAFSYNVVGSYGSYASAYGLIFMGGHFVWAFSLMFLFSGRGYWQELIESIMWAHNKLKVGPSIAPRALSITQGRAVGVAHYLLGGIGVTWAFLLGKF
jgi:photosystem I P700 chlorophyll a apoprotein A1